MQADVARFDVDGSIAVVTIDSPPVNALGQPVRQALQNAVERLAEDDNIDALVIRCAGRTFFAGADIREFGQPLLPPALYQLADAIEASSKPIVAAIHGTALGGGLEVAMACHFRVAATSAKLGLPEVTLGLLPGAGGTQRLPRLVGVEKALAMMLSGTPVGAVEAEAINLVDRLCAEDTLLQNAVAIAREAADGTRPVRRTRDRAVDLAALDAQCAAAAKGRNAHLDAPRAILRVVREGLRLSWEDAQALNRAAFQQLRDGAQSRALRHIFFAERASANVPGIDATTPVLPVERVGVIGAGTMGRGIAASFLLAGMPVVLVEQDETALSAGAAAIRAIFARNEQTGRMSSADAERAEALLSSSLGYDALVDADLIVEAAYETMEVKRAIFSRLDAIAKPGAILATNTSYLDVDAIAAITSRPESVVGLHFFSPANIMKLLEIVRGARTSPAVLATALRVAKRIGKIPVVAGVCYGFIGNRMLAARRRKVEQMIAEGASPYAIDAVAEEFGFAMGPFRVADLAGLDLGWSRAQSTGSTIRERLCELDRRGQKTGAGFYDYDEARKPVPSALVEQLIADFAADKGIARREWTREELLDGLLSPLIEEGKAILAEGIALRASDIDTVWVHGYGWPRWRGGPMFHAGIS